MQSRIESKKRLEEQVPLPFCVFLEPSVVSTLLVHATCNAHLLTYAIKRAFHPPLVAQLMGPFPPPQGQGARICRLLRTETWRQIGLLKDFLRLRCSFGSSRRPELSFSQEMKVVAQLSDKLWLHILPKLPKRPPARPPAPILSDLLLAHYDRKLQDQLASKGSIKIFRYVDDFLVLFPAKLEDAPAEISNSTWDANTSAGPTLPGPRSNFSPFRRHTQGQLSALLHSEQ
ncbi:hypothetical protein HPB52_004305 [Rhipicephalus sanguineus]|uniref:Tick transposon n=1 Tax=Rhipicephalus sanguineus TaxID=34632 RepID=A0A9D4QJA5_RHISA|nr:hypothetical protein HPB52_004305 [Rhipicephalus sanguineus]